MNFKVNDRVKCIDNKAADTLLTRNKIYSILRIEKSEYSEEDYMYIINDLGYIDSFYHKRFKLLKKEIKISNYAKWLHNIEKGGMR